MGEPGMRTAVGVILRIAGLLPAESELIPFNLWTQAWTGGFAYEGSATMTAGRPRRLWES